MTVTGLDDLSAVTESGWAGDKSATTVRAVTAGVVAVCACGPFSDDAVTDAVEGAFNAVRRGVLALGADGGFNARLIDGFNVAASAVPNLDGRFTDDKPVPPPASCLQLGHESADDSPRAVSLGRGELVRGPPVPVTVPAPGSAEPAPGALFGFGVLDFDDASGDGDLGFAVDLMFRG
jgi:hypothetical protein